MNCRKVGSEYDLSKLKRIRPKNRSFEMLVNPSHYDFYYRNAYEDYTADLLGAFTKDGSLFIDVGAHYGFYTLLVGTKNKNSRIIAFEPVPENCEILEKSLQLNNVENVELHNLAISDKNETGVFNIAACSSRGGFHQAPLSRTIRTIEVKIVTLDSFLQGIPQTPVVVKIDTEGHEIHVLEGMKNIIEEAEDVKLFIEFSPSCIKSGGYQPADLLNKISQFGFDMYFINDEQRELYKLSDNGIRNWETYYGGNFGKDYFNTLCVKKEKSLSVCFFSHTSNLAGAERCLLELTTSLIRDHGLVCSVVLPSVGSLKEKLEEVGVSTQYAGYSWWCDVNSLTDGQIDRELDDSFKHVLGHIKHKLNKINPDVVCTNTMVIPWGAIAASVLGKPHVWFIHEFGVFGRRGFRFFIPFQKILEIIYHSSNMIVTNSNAVREMQFGNTFRQNVVTVYPPVSINSSSLQPTDTHHFKEAHSTKLIVTGLISESKGQKDAILAVRELDRRKRNIELIIMGHSDPQYLAELKAIVESESLERRVRFLDFQQNPYPVVAEADIVLLCSRIEAFGLVTLEAMLLKKPVVGANAGGTPELIKEEFNGLLYEPGNYDQLADKIEYLIEHKDKVTEFGENGYRFATKGFTSKEYGSKVYELLCKVKNEANPSTTPYFQFFTRLVSHTLFAADSIESAGEPKKKAYEVQMKRIHQDIAIAWLNRYERIIYKLVPPGTRRGNLYLLELQGVRIILVEGVKAFCLKASRYIGERLKSLCGRVRVGKA